MTQDNDDDDRDLSRRKLLKSTAALTALAIAGCSSDDDDDTTPGNNAGSKAAGGSGEAAAGDEHAGSQGASGTTASQAGRSGSQALGGTGSGNAGTTSGGSGDPTMDGGEPTSDSGAQPTPSGKITVAIVRISDIDMAAARAIELAGGIDEIQPGQTVFIKPNAVSNRAIGTPGIRTSNELIAAVVRLVKQRNPGRIIVGDRSARGFETTAVFADAGIADAAMAAGADEIYTAPSPVDEPDAWMLLQPDGYMDTWQAAGGILAMRKIIEADHLINVPTCKNHRYALHSLSMKNFIGAIGDSSRDPLHYNDTISGNFEPLCRDIAVLNQMFSPLISIIDTQVAVINGGPQGDGADTVRTTPGLLLASKNRIALDAMALSLIKLELSRTDVPQPDASHAMLMDTRPWDMPQLKYGTMHGIGPAGPDDIELAFEDVDDQAALEMIYKS